MQSDCGEKEEERESFWFQLMGRLQM